MRTVLMAGDKRLFASGELSDDDLEHVVGGLTRPWDFGARPVYAPAVPALSVSILGAVPSVERISA